MNFNYKQYNVTIQMKTSDYLNGITHHAVHTKERTGQANMHNISLITCDDRSTILSLICLLNPGYWRKYHVFTDTETFTTRNALEAQLLLLL